MLLPPPLKIPLNSQEWLSWFESLSALSGVYVTITDEVTVSAGTAASIVVVQGRVASISMDIHALGACTVTLPVNMDKGVALVSNLSTNDSMVIALIGRSFNLPSAGDYRVVINRPVS